MSDPSSDESMSSQLAQAASVGDLSEVQGIVRNWPSNDPMEKSLQPALSNAVRQGHVSVASYLMDQGATFHADMGNAAVSCEHAEDMFQVALDHGWNINSRTTIGLPFFACVSSELPLSSI